MILGRVLVAGDERDARGDTPVRDGDARVGGGGDPARDAGDDLEGYSRFYQGKRLLTAAPEDVRVAPLQAHHRLAGAAELDEEGVDLLLRHRGLSGLLADVDKLRFGPRVFQQALRGEPVVDDGVGLFQALYAPYGEEARITGAATDEVDQDSPSVSIVMDGPLLRPAKRKERQLNPPSTFLNSDISSSMTSYPLSTIFSFVFSHPPATRT